MSIREQIKNGILKKAEAASEQIQAISKKREIPEEEVQDRVHRYVCMKFFLDPDEGKEFSLYELAELSLERAIDMNLPLAKESERATTCGTAGSAPMKVALMLNALRKEFRVNIAPRALGMARDTRELGSLFYRALQEEMNRDDHAGG